LGDPSAKVRAAAADALGAFGPDLSSIAALNLHASYDASYAVIAKSVQSLGAMKAPGAQNVLARALKQPSDRGVIASGALEGYAKLQGSAAIPLEERYAIYGAPPDTRDAAITALGELSHGHPEVFKFLGGLFGDPNPRINRRLVMVLSATHDFAAIPYLQHYADSLPYADRRRVVQQSIVELRTAPPQSR
jgi:HEAT repeat protein